MAENSMSITTVEGQSISKPPYFDGTNHTDWKERMRTFIQSVDFKLWLVITNGPKIPKKIVEGNELEKSEDEFNDEDMKNMEQEAKAKNILYCAVNPDALKRISRCKSAKEMWEELVRDPEDAKSVVDSTTPESQMVPSHNYPNHDFADGNRDEKDKFLNLCVPLHKFALEGNWPAAKRILDEDKRLRCAAISGGWPTVLHIAAGANQVDFVDQLLTLLTDKEIALQDYKGNTAFCFAVASGNLKIAELMLKRNQHLPLIRGGKDYTPIQFAALQGRCKMTCYLYDQTTKSDAFQDQDWNLLFFTCINTGNNHLALRMARERKELAFARDENDDTALHLLAQNHKPLDSSCQCHNSEHHNPIVINPCMNKQLVFQLVKFLWTTILKEKDFKPEITDFIRKPSKLLFDAAEVGNFGFLSELISAYPSLIWEVNSKNQSIIHTAVLHRHASIYNLIHEIGSHKDIIVRYIDKDGNILLHLAAKLAPSSQLELVSGAAFQMCLELLWFEEVKKNMAPSLENVKNGEDLTPGELFTREHKELRRNAECWMKGTAESCMLISTVIATGVFAAAISIPGGISDDTGTPHYLKKTPFLVFAISDAIAFISSATAILIFLSILVSRYAEYDFYMSLPLKLIFGLLTLFISITSMMVAFSSAFFITYNYGSKWVPDYISILACVPILLFISLQFSLWSDIIYSTYYCRNLFKPGKKIIYV